MCARVLVHINGSVGEEFFMERGLCQGCPLSPLPFNLVAESLVDQFEDFGWLKGMQINGLNERPLSYNIQMIPLFSKGDQIIWVLGCGGVWLFFP